MTLPTLAILAGGLAIRLLPLTLTVPKSLIDVNGEPFLAHQLRLARKQGFANVVILTGHLGHMISDFVGNGVVFDLNVSYYNDRVANMGSGGAVRDALSELGEEFAVLYGDSYLDVDIKPAFQKLKDMPTVDAMMLVLRNRDQWDASNVIYRENVVTAHEKNSSGQLNVEWIDYGMTIFRRAAFRDFLQSNAFDLSELTSHLARAGRLGGYEVTQRFYEIGKPEGLSETSAYIASQLNKG